MSKKNINIFGLKLLTTDRAGRFLPARVSFVRSNPHWEYKRNKATKARRGN